MQIPSAYGLGQVGLQASRPPLGFDPAPDLITPALNNVANAVAGYGDVVARTDLANRELDLRTQRAAEEADFRLKAGSANAELDYSTAEIAKQTVVNVQDEQGNWTQRPSTDADQRAELDTVKEGITTALTKDVNPQILQQYLPAVQHEMAKADVELSRTQAAVSEIHAAKGALMLGAQMPEIVATLVAGHSDPTQAKQAYQQYYQSTLSDIEKQTRDMRPEARARIMEDYQIKFQSGLVDLSKGFVKKGQQQAAMEFDGITQQFKSMPAALANPESAVREYDYFMKLYGGTTGKTPETMLAEREKFAQEMYSEGTKLRYDTSLHSEKALGKFIKDISATTKTGEWSYLPEMDNKTRETYRNMATEKLLALQRENASKAETRSNQDFTLTKDLIKDATDNHQMPSSTLIQRLSNVARTPMQREYVNHVIKKVNSEAYRNEAMAADPYQYTVSTLNIPEKDRQVLLTPLTTKNMAQLLPARIAIAVTAGVPPLTAAEAASIVSIGKNRTTQQAVDAVVRLTSQLPQSLRASTFALVSEQVGRKDPVLGNTLAAASIDPALSSLYMNGAELLKDKSADADVRKSLKEYQADISGRLKSTGITNYTADYDRIIDIYTKSAAGIQARTGVKPSDDALEGLFKKVVGEVITTSTGAMFGSKGQTIVPNGVDARKVENFSRNDQPELAKQYGVDVKVLRAPLFWSPGGYKLVKDGRYQKDSTGRDIVIPFEKFGAM